MLSLKPAYASLAQPAWCFLAWCSLCICLTAAFFNMILVAWFYLACQVHCYSSVAALHLYACTNPPVAHTQAAAGSCHGWSS